jgi:hypothetical protein
MTESQKKPKLNEEQRAALLGWLAAEYSEPLIRKWFEERKWEPLAESTISYHRKRYASDIEAARSERRASAINSGLALKEERIKRLAEHADELEAIKWLADEKTGRLWNEKSWRETLDDIAKEMGHRRTGIDLDLVEKELDATLDKLKDNLSPELYAQVLTAIARGSG